MEGVKLFQTIIINWDLDMYYEPADKPFQCRALNINEDLGQIEYVFTDKTGTLTENEMIFRCCCIAGNNYPHGLIGNPHIIIIFCLFSISLHKLFCLFFV